MATKIQAPPVSEVRPEVIAFARLMEMKLRENDHKGGWKRVENGEILYFPPKEALRRLYEEAGEVANELQAPHERCNCREAGCMHVSPWWKPDPERTGREAADVANFALMIADACGAIDAITTE